ncbi:VOC family protein [Paracoccus aerius]|nr:glyoxalase [Paracoccus aerius]
MTHSAALLTASLAGRTSAGDGSPAGMTSAGAPLRLGSVTLRVRDLNTVGRFYRDIIGLSVIEQGARRQSLGVGSTVLLELIEDPAARLASRTEAGLFHTAFLLPERADLAEWLLHAADLGAPLQGASDHLVSEAVYLADPEGNGIEIYWDRPSHTWIWQSGMVDMATRRLDLQNLARQARNRNWKGLPERTIVGHVHLQVGDLGQAEDFYSGLLGLDVVHRVPGASFFSSGGYHHHIAGNVWNSAGAGRTQPGATGLLAFEVVPADAQVQAGLLHRAERLTPREHARLVEVADPWGITLVLRAPFS